MEKKLVSKEDYKWLYDLKNDRFYTYEELKSRRELNPFPNQMNDIGIKLNQELVKEFNEVDLKNPYNWTINYDDHENLLPEVHMTKEWHDSDEGRRYMKMIQKVTDLEANASYQELEDEENAEEADDKKSKRKAKPAE